MAATLDYAALAQRRVGCKVEGYDMITAVTQNAMNKQFAAMWIVEESLRTLEIRNKTTQKVKMFCTMGAPKANLLMGTSNKEVLFFLKLQKGWFEWYNQDIEENRKTAIENWVLAFTVNLQQEVLPATKVPNKIKQVLEQSGLGVPGDYTVAQLLINFSTAKLSNYNEEHSFVPDISPEAVGLSSVSEVAQMRVAFSNFIKQYLEVIKLSPDGSPTTIAFIPTEFKARQTSLTPTILRFQNYPFKVQVTDTDVSAETFEGGKHNMLLYLEMTESRPLPPLALNTSQPWVVPGADNRLIDGCVTLSRRIFLDEWFIPKMVALNRLTDITAGPTTYSVEYGAFGRPNKQIFSYGWSKALDPALDYNFKFAAVVDGHIVYNFTHLSGPATLSGEGMRGHAAVRNYVKIPIAPADGVCKIIVGGHSKAEIEMDGPKVDLYVSGEFTWSSAFVFREVANHGGLSVTMDPAIPERPVVTGERREDNPNGWIFRGPEPKDAIQTTLTDYHVGPVLDDMDLLFKGDWQFYFGGSDSFFFKNALFNEEGGLMLELAYMGA